MRFLLIIIFISLINAQDICEIDGRKELKFGMSPNKVKTLDLDWISKSTSYVKGVVIGTNHSTYFGMNYAEAMCTFKNDNLYGIIYTFNNSTTDNNSIFNMYFDLKDNLIKKYGEATRGKENIKTISDDEPRNSVKAGTELALGRGSYLLSWECETNQTSIMLSMSATDYELILTLYYLDDNYNIETEKETDILDDF